MPRSVLALMSLGWIFSAASYHSADSWKRPASKYMLASCTRVTASVGFCCAVSFIAEARDSSSGGGAGWPPPACAADGAAAALLAADDPPHQHPEEHAGHAHDESISRHDEPRSYVLTLPIPNYATP